MVVDKRCPWDSIMLPTRGCDRAPYHTSSSECPLTREQKIDKV